MSVCICSNSLAADYRAASPRRSHVVVLPHFHPYSPISSAPYLRRPLLPSPSTTRLDGYSAVSRNRTRNVSKEAMYRQRNDSPLLARSFSCLFHFVSAYHPLIRLFDTHFIVNQYYAALIQSLSNVFHLWKKFAWLYYFEISSFINISFVCWQYSL